MKKFLPSLRLLVFFGITILSGNVSRAEGKPAAPDWNVSLLDQVLSTVKPGQKQVSLGDMDILVSNVQTWRDQLAGNYVAQSAFDGTAPLWPGGNVYYTFASSGTSNVTANLQKAFLDAAAEWAIFANLHFILRTTQANYVTVVLDPNIGSSGHSSVGMVGGQQFITFGPYAWGHGIICHELGHTLGLVHEHQRSDRDSFITVNSNNVAPGTILNFVKLGNSRNVTAYDFLSVMHYGKWTFSANYGDTNFYTMVPLPAYSQYLNVMGVTGPVVLSALDRLSMATNYGAGPGASSVVTNTQDSGVGSLRASLYYAYDHPGTHITFNIPTNDPGYAGGVFTIHPSDQFPSLVNNTFLDGKSQPTNAASNTSGPIIQLNGTQPGIPGAQLNGIEFAGTNSRIHGFTINNFAGNAVDFSGTGAVSNTVSGCYLGIDPTGTFAVTNGYNCISIGSGANGNTIGGLAVSNRNIISGSYYQGLVITDPGTVNNKVQGNYIGLNAAGSASLPSRWAGLVIANGAQNNIIGGTNSFARNIISGNSSEGVYITDAGTSGNIVEGNYIGLNPAGTAALPNGYSGVSIGGLASFNIIGGSSTNLRNIISGNSQQGVVFGGSGTGFNRVAGNYIGLNPSGTAAIPNGWAGVELDFGAVSNWVGGLLPGSGNTISGNGIQGVAIRDAGTSGNIIAGNWIGLNGAQTAALGNSASGVESFFNAGPNQIGTPGGRNYISGNLNYGVLIDSSSVSNVIQANTIGLTSGGTAAPNAWAGVTVFGSASNTLIGGTAIGTANLIASNSSDAIQLFDNTTFFTTVRGNSIHDNNGYALADYRGATTNNPAVPSLFTAILSTNTTVTGSVAVTMAGNYLLDLYANAPSTYVAQGQTYLGAKTIAASGAGTSNFTFTTSAIVPNGWQVTASTTDPAGNTSSFSTGVIVTVTDSVGDGIPNVWRAKYFGGSGTTTNSNSCSQCDADHDGMSNLQEFLSGTNPTNATSRLLVSGVSVNGTNLIVCYASVAGFNYRVDYKDDNSIPGWNILADQLLGTGGTSSVTNLGAALNPKRFYRVGVQP